MVVHLAVALAARKDVQMVVQKVAKKAEKMALKLVQMWDKQTVSKKANC